MNKKQISILMGSDSDLSVMKGACECLKQFGVEFTIRVLSAHRTPSEVVSWISELEKQNFQVIIAGAGGAAHLAGVIAAHTTLPVIGVPISSSLHGVDALYSIVQMPNGIPVATVGIDRAKNAALLAISILALNDKELKKKLGKYRLDMQKDVLKKDAKLNEIGWEKYV
ncbi:5-(carboxyamino)imidazole ribonucleotide mutase [Candidatus Poribacteria bacterium]|nr:5-(carboxyamino)imidazole ribonucleotide mutase [Candidatus Poribacteria bacterium]